VAELEIVVDVHERYAYRSPRQAARTVSRKLPCGDYGVTVAGRLVVAVERKSVADLVSSLTGGKLAYALADLASLPRAALVVEDRYSAVFGLDWVRPAIVADGLAELQVRWPNVPTVFCETRALAEEWTYRYLAAAYAWAEAEPDAVARIGGGILLSTPAPPGPGPTTAEIRAGARAQGLTVADRGRLRPDILDAYHTAHPQAAPAEAQ